MLTELITLFTGVHQNRRKYPRRPGPFPAWVAIGTAWAPVICVDLSGGGLGVAAPATLPEELNLRIRLENRDVLVRAKRVWQRPGTSNGKAMMRYGLTFTGISADDWDAVVRYCSGGDVTVENKAQKELELVRLQADDVARLIPMKLQDTMLSMLVTRGRLAPIDEKTPLVQYSYGGVTKRNGLSLHRLTIHSRIHDDVTGEAHTYDTHFFFDDDGTHVTIDE
jgi:hypothetical protein